MSSDTTEQSDDGEVFDWSDSTDSDPPESMADLAAQAELLAEENRRLRAEYVRARQTTHRKTALGLFAIGALAVLGAVAFPGSRTVLFALGATGLFAGVLTYYLTPEEFVAAETGERVYAACAATGTELVGELGLADDRIYAPVRTGNGGVADGAAAAGVAADGAAADGAAADGAAANAAVADGAAADGAAAAGVVADGTVADVRLFVPSRSDYVVPDAEELESLFVVTDRERERGVSLSPTGGGLYHEFESAMVEEVAKRPSDLADQLADALAEGFELVESARADTDPERGRLTVEIAGSAYGAVDRFDHPVASLLGVGVAANLDGLVSVSVMAAEEGPADWFVTCEWDPEEVESVGD